MNLLTNDETTNRNNGQISVKLLGGFGSLTESSISLKVKGEKTLKEFLEALAERYSLDLKGFGSFFLVLIDGVEASLLGGLKARVKPGCELILLRISHGG